MTSSDDEFLAPVINLFGDRSGAKRNGAADLSPEGSPTLESSGGQDESPAWADSRAADLTPVRALPTMADFSPAQSSEQTPDADDSQTQAEPVGAQSQAQRRQARDGFSEISQVSMRALARRGMSSHEMTQFLATRDFDSEDIDGEVERLESCGLLDDAALAETLARTLRDRKKLGASGIRAELRRRNIDQEHIAAVLDDDRDEEQERANEIAFKRAPQLRSLDGVTAKRRLTGFLMRKGYSGSVVSAAVAAALSSGSSESSGGPTFR